MPQALLPGTFRVFISSSFADMHAERNRLQRHVFPRLQRYCKARGARFQAIDLRWGISRELAERNETMATCLREVDRCKRLSPRPTLVILLGTRSGWTPAPPTISTSTWDRVWAASTTEQQLLLRSSYELDTNALPACYVLVQRGNASTPADDWSSVEPKLCAALRPHFDIVSATETEIRHALNGGLLPGSAFAYFRALETEPGSEVPEAFLEPESLPRLERLWTALEAQLGSENCQRLTARWSAAGVSREYLERLCEDLFVKLRHTIDEQLDSPSETAWRAPDRSDAAPPPSYAAPANALEAGLAARGRGLDTHQWRVVLASLRGESPSALVTASVTELCRFRSGQRISDPWPDTEQGLYSWVLLPRLVEAHGLELVRRLLGYLLLSRAGLSEDELLDLGSADPAILQEVAKRYPESPAVERLPVVLWSRLYDDLEAHLEVGWGHGLPFIRATAGLQAAFWQSVGADLPVRQMRYFMAHYFSTQGHSARQLEERAWQAFKNDNWPELKRMLTDPVLLVYLEQEDPALLDAYRTALAPR